MGSNDTLLLHFVNMVFWGALLALLASPALAAGTIQQSGNVTPNHSVMWTTNGVVQDGGSATHGFLSELGVTKNGGCAIGINSLGVGITSGAYDQFCLGVGSNGVGYLSLQTYGGAPPSSLNFILDGVTYAFPYTVGGIVGPTTTISGDAVCWNNVSGSLVKDCGAPPALFVGDTVALQALPTTILALTNKVRVGTYLLPVGSTVGIASPPVDYYLTSAACTPDGGSCFNAQGGKYWHITPQTVYDARWWGAYADVQSAIGIVTVTSGSCSISTGFFESFASTDIGKLITITDGVSGGTNGASYIGTIAGFTDGQHITVSAPCPTFNSTQNQHIAYGHDDAAAWNKADAFMGTLVAGGATGQPVLSAGGRSIGYASASVNITANAKYANIDFLALGFANLGFTCATTNAFCTLAQGISTNIGLNLGAAFSSVENIVSDANYLPINPCFTLTNGTIRWNTLRCKNEQGSISSVNVAGASTTTAASINGSLANCVSTSGGEPYFCQLNVSAISSGSVQPGQALTGAGIPNGTYVSQFGTDNFTAGATGTGGFGQYTVVNYLTTLSTVGSEAMTTLGLEVTVSACNQTNFTTLFNPVGLVYHNNANFNGLNDRTFIVGCANSTTMVLNKAPLKAFSGQTLVFNQDSNGFLLIGNEGVQINNLSISQDDAAYFGQISNHYGCGQLVDGAGGSGFWHVSIGYSAANICQGPDSANNQWRYLVTVGVAAGGNIDLNSPAFLSMDGAQTTTLSDIALGGQVQFFLLTSGSNTQNSILQNEPLAQGAQTLYAPNNSYWFYTTLPNANTGFMNLDFPYKNENTPNASGLTGGSPYVVNFTTEGSGNWQQYTPAEIARLSRTMNPYIPPNSGNSSAPVQPMQTLGLDLNTAPLTASENCLETYSATPANAIHEADTGCAVFISQGSTPVTITLGADIGANSSGAFFPSAFNLPFLEAHTTQTVTLVATAGILLEGGVGVSGAVTLTNNVPYSVSCPFNASGASPICFLSSGAGSSQNVALSSGPMTSASTAVFSFSKISRAGNVVSLAFSSAGFTCSVNPVIQVLECGGSTTCIGGTVIGSATLTTGSTVVNGTISSASVGAGDWIAGQIASGTCSSINPYISVELQQN